ncbi:MAG: tetratricopeptide repeat protein [Anaerolineales bacterium]|nr:tetratricopeptide repeat protein [Anaerolineales bacterium]
MSADPLPLNRTKIVIPALRPEILHRERLLGFFDELLEKKLLLVTAPAGYGKTTFLVDMAHHTEMAVCWLTLDEVDRDPQRFSAYLIAALAERFPQFGRQSVAALKRLVSFAEDGEQLLSTLVNEVYERIGEHFVLVIDDFHFVDAVTGIAGFVSRFIHLAADHCHVVLASRRLPTLPDIALLVARQQVIGFDLEELAFRADEICQLFASQYGVDLDEATLERLIQRTEGWITGLHLSAPDAAGVIPDLSRAARAAGVDLAGYFDQQVLAPQPAALRRFLLQTSVLGEFDAELCAAVLGDGNWKRQVEAVRRSNLFVLPVGPHGRALRYHPLFRDFLLSRYLEEDPVGAQALFMRLAAVCTERGDWDRAYQIYQQYGNQTRLADLTEQAGPAMLLHERLLTLRTWLDSLPASLLDERAALLSLKGAFLCAAGKGSDALPLLDRAVAAFRPGSRPDGLALALVRRAAARRLVGDYAGALQDSEESLVLSADFADLAAVYAEAARFKGLSLFRLGQASLAARSLQDSLQAYERLGEAPSIARLQMELGIAYRALGNDASALQAYEQALAEWRRENNLHSQANVLNSLGVLHHSRGDYESALRTLEDGLNCARQGGLPWQRSLLLVSLGDVYIDLDEFDAAGQAYEMATEIAYQVSYQFLINYLGLAQARLARLRGQFQEARAHLTITHTFIQSNESGYERSLWQLESGRLALVCGDPDQAAGELVRAVDGFRQGNLVTENAVARFWLAVARLAGGDLAAARRDVEESLADVRPGQEVQALVQAVRRARPWLAGLVEDPQVGPLLSAWLEQAEQVEARLPGLHKRLRQLDTSVPLQGARLAIRGLGRPQVRVNGRLVTSSQWQTTSVRDLFFYLLSVPRPVTKEEIGAVFWPEMDARQLKLRFKNDLYRLRRALGSEVVLFGNDLYCFNSDLDYEYDVEAFESLLARARSAGGAEEQVRHLAAAVRLWDGPYLRDLDADWVWPERERLRQKYLEALQELAGLYRQEGNPERALQTCHRALREDPCLEQFHCLAMELYAGRGDRVAVTRQYQACRKALRLELDLEPAPETEALYRRLMG